jgi:hypothetical protein
MEWFRFCPPFEDLSKMSIGVGIAKQSAVGVIKLFVVVADE